MISAAQIWERLEMDSKFMMLSAKERAVWQQVIEMMPSIYGPYVMHSFDPIVLMECVQMMLIEMRKSNLFMALAVAFAVDADEINETFEIISELVDSILERIDQLKARYSDPGVREIIMRRQREEPGMNRLLLNMQEKGTLTFGAVLEYQPVLLLPEIKMKK